MTLAIANDAVPTLSTTIPARLDRLPWSTWHTRVIIALSVTWLLDGLEGSLGGSLAGTLKSRAGLSLTDADLGLSSSLYLVGAVVGALVFGYLADRFGRRRLFTWTLILYLSATAATGLSHGLFTFTLCRVLTGAGIGGEYAAINSAVDELIPARLRGRVDLWINATFWLGIILGSGISTAFLVPSVFGEALGWRLAFCSGVPIGLLVLILRRYIPESPRWLLTHNRSVEAEAVIANIEATLPANHAHPSLSEIELSPRSSFASIAQILAGPYRRRSFLCFFLMAAQAFFYNSVFFSLALVLLQFYGVSPAHVGVLFIPIAVTNFLGPALLGRLFDTIGRRQMICATYCLSGVTLFASSLLFYQHRLTLTEQVAWWSVTFFFASTAASSAYLTVSEVFPQQIRASAIAVFYAFGTLAGGVFGPLIFGHLTSVASRTPLLIGYTAGATVMIAAGLAQAIWGVPAERRPLEELRIPSELHVAVTGK
ncbi:MFS family permease [Granulicella aggregans]|uniref:MFS family permease n=1 Tax=Granulicella aggregans TaxID=474949 RepID=A0A7W7ZH23_9BACT|nr:MFS transporter [Granulicella aggregans]MBB5059126.1 MFS family permease [Granulicella aggregans]